MKGFLFVVFICCCFHSVAQQTTSQQFREDFDYFWNTLDKHYAYWDKKATDWKGVKELYAAEVDTIKTKWHFTLFLERVFNEIYDPHASLSTNTSESQKLVPSGTDIWASYQNRKTVITEVRFGSGAAKAGLRAGMEIASVNDVPIEKALFSFYPRSLKYADAAAEDHALRVALAGRHSQKRKITVRYQGSLQSFFPDEEGLTVQIAQEGRLTSKRLAGNIGYIRVNNCLWDNDLIPEFDSVLNSMMDTKALILDLRETPSGGNTTVARAILGRFIAKEGFYQAHELTAEEKRFGVKRSWKEIVSPRKDTYTKPLVLLVNHWTGSVGEGIAIGFDAFKRATIIGTQMAGLNGAIYSYQMPHSKIGFSIPAEKLFHVNGTPRELFKPAIVVDLTWQKADEDLILKQAIYFSLTSKR
jgi:carboxyl-terminal processing protease